MKNKPHAQASGHALRTTRRSTRRNTRRLRAALVPLLFALMGAAHARKPVSVEPLKHDAHDAHEAKSQAGKRDAHRVTPRRVSSSQHALRAHRRLQTGIASWYGREFHGHRTANGERFDMYALTAAHRTLPFGSFARVTLPATGRSVIVRINDRGPYARGRVIDLSFGAARVLGYSSAGSARVRIEPVAARQASALQGTRRAKRPVRRAKPTPPPKTYRAR